MQHKLNFGYGAAQPPVRVVRGATGATGCPGMPGMRGAPGPRGATGPAGCSSAAVYCGLFNNCVGEVDIDADDVLALTFNQCMPANGMQVDENRCIIVAELGVYEIDYHLRGLGLCDGSVQLAVTHNGSIIPCTAGACAFHQGEPFQLCSLGLAELDCDAQLHFVVYSKHGASFQLADGVNLALRLRRV
ncbi:MAG: collagen-like protein [Oscillospiraceae bacterium]|nr:collagen-like protein [Oscillospiraceae bacterium]